MNWMPDERVALFAVMDDGPIAIATRAVSLMAARGEGLTADVIASIQRRVNAMPDVTQDNVFVVATRDLLLHSVSQGAQLATLQARIADLDGRLATEEAERIRCRDGWAAASAQADRLSLLESEVERLRVEAADFEASAARHIQEAASLRVKMAGLEEALVKEKASHELEKRAHEDTFVQKVLRIEERDALRTKVVELEGRAWVQCTTVSNECLGGCRSMKEHDRQRHQQLVSEVEGLKAEVEIGAEIVRDHASRLAAIREIVLKVRKAPRGEAVDSDTYDRGFGDGWVARGAKMRAELDALDADTPNHPASLDSSPGNSPKISDGSGEAQRGANAVPVLPGDFALTCSACGGVKPHRWRPSPEAGDFWRCSECGEPSKAARTPGHPERIAALSKRFTTASGTGALATDALHPNGRCTCGGEGICQWCTETAGREETDVAIEFGAVASSFPATTTRPPFQEGYDEGVDVMRAACWEAVRKTIEPEGQSVGSWLYDNLKLAIEGAAP